MTTLIDGRYTPAQILAGTRALKSHDVTSGRLTPREAFCAAAGIDERTFDPPDFVQDLLHNASKPERDKREHRAAILALPEARERPKAAARIADIQLSTGPVELHRAKAVLASLPSELAEQRAADAAAAHARQSKAEATGPGNLKRRVEMRLSALTHRANQGDAAAMTEARKLIYAMRIVAQSPNTSMSQALSLAGVDVASIK